MYILKKFQEKAVSDLLAHTFDALQERRSQTPILLEAPTGSGKTVMMAALLERIITELPMETGISGKEVTFIWIAPNTLHLQSYTSLKELYKTTNSLRCMDLSELNSNPALQHGELLFVNWSAIDKEKNIWRKSNETNTNLETLIQNTKAEGVKIILIIDEAHLSALTGQQAIAVRKLIKADVEIMVTATPTFQRPQRSVVISRHKVISEQMIKKGVRINIGLRPEDQQNDNVHIHLLRTAFQKKKQLQELFDEELGAGVINPLILIQLPSENVAITDEEKELRKTLEWLLESDYNITLKNGRLAVWLSGERNKDGLENMNGLQDVLIFKQAIAQGWDCPRATILVSYRTINSPQFGIQTVGRILRMPHQRHYKNDALNFGYVYSNIQTNKIQFVPADSDYFEKQLATRRNDPNITYPKLISENIVNDRQAAGVLSTAFEKIFFSVMEQRYGLVQLPDFTIETYQADNYANLKANNYEALRINGWEFEIDIHQIHIPVEIEVDPYEVNSIIVNNNQMGHFAVTTAQFSVLFDKFCHDNITRFNRSKSWKKLRQTLLHFAEYYLDMFETEAKKLFLYPQNKEYLVQLIAEALEEFDEWQKAKGNVHRRVEQVSWEVPEVRYYSEHYKQEVTEKHALEPFYESLQASNVEVQFKQYLEEHKEHIAWWYKNGDSGKEHFSVTYKSTAGELRQFYVDFIIHFKSGKVGLFDTKTKRSDSEAANKHNALLDYILKENREKPDIERIGGIIIPEEQAGILSFRYPTTHISDTHDLTNWAFLRPLEI